MRRLGTVVDHDPKAVVCQPLLLGHLGRGHHQVPQELLVLLVGEVEAGEPHPLLRDNKDVGGRRRVDVLEGEALLVLIDLVRRYVT